MFWDDSDGLREAYSFVAMLDTVLPQDTSVQTALNSLYAALDVVDSLAMAYTSGAAATSAALPCGARLALQRRYYGLAGS